MKRKPKNIPNFLAWFTLVGLMLSGCLIGQGFIFAYKALAPSKKRIPSYQSGTCFTMKNQDIWSGLWKIKAVGKYSYLVAAVDYDDGFVHHNSEATNFNIEDAISIVNCPKTKENK